MTINCIEWESGKGGRGASLQARPGGENGGFLPSSPCTARPAASSILAMFSGSFVALVTPMKVDGAVDDEALERLVEFHIANGTSGIVAVGTTGESPPLRVEEHIGVVRTVVRRAAKRIPVIAGTGANSTREAIELTQLAKDAGADACLMVTPYYNKPTQEGLFQHYKAVAENVSVPIVLYTVPR